jgi:hypothetical protein
MRSTSTHHLDRIGVLKVPVCHAREHWSPITLSGRLAVSGQARMATHGQNPIAADTVADRPEKLLCRTPWS